VKDLSELFEPVVEAMGYEFVGVEFTGGSGHGTLSIYIDREQGVDVDDCASISHQVSAILDVEDPIQQAFDLQVSSPGINRPLFKLSDYDRFVGEIIKIKLDVALNGRKNFKGILNGVVQSKLVQVDVDGENFQLPFLDIGKANLVGQF
jgi:ribosome maturation factor RimP|tara:strand:+ start:644 stop:1090 length:447 start_codon:yes stop_codon:yes gene_type:complete